MWIKAQWNSKFLCNIIFYSSLLAWFTNCPSSVGQWADSSSDPQLVGWLICRALLCWYVSFEVIVWKQRAQNNLVLLKLEANWLCDGVFLSRCIEEFHFFSKMNNSFIVFLQIVTSLRCCKTWEFELIRITLGTFPLVPVKLFIEHGDIFHLYNNIVFERSVQNLIRTQVWTQTVVMVATPPLVMSQRTDHTRSGLWHHWGGFLDLLWRSSDQMFNWSVKLRTEEHFNTEHERVNCLVSSWMTEPQQASLISHQILNLKWWFFHNSEKSENTNKSKWSCCRRPLSRTVYLMLLLGDVCGSDMKPSGDDVIIISWWCRSQEHFLGVGSSLRIPPQFWQKQTWVCGRQSWSGLPVTQRGSVIRTGGGVSGRKHWKNKVCKYCDCKYSK